MCEFYCIARRKQYTTNVLNKLTCIETAYQALQMRWPL